MFDLKELCETILAEVEIKEEFSSLSKKASDFEEKIKAVYSFHVFENEITIWCDSMLPKMKLKLTHDGIAKFYENNQAFEIKCDRETIYQYMKAYHIVNSKYFESEKEKLGNEYVAILEKRAAEYKHLNNFINETLIRYVNMKAEENKKEIS